MDTSNKCQRKHVKDYEMFFHLTSLDNLDSILEQGILPRADLTEQFSNFDDVADSEIISFRERVGLDKYVPFHFFPHNPFDGRVQTDNPNKTFIYICLHKRWTTNNRFKVIPTHPKHMDKFKMYNYEEGLTKIDWDLMNTRDYNNYECKQLCMAECVIDAPVPFRAFHSIAVKDESTKKIVEDKVKIYNKKCNVKVYVNIRRSWFV
ncbi:DUF4433 domain-containing protein [Paraclostridium bifermentans]|uniref:DarT ssDNA thymidine ADP-ribosyltransferase family protein n=1 Tax=Paraclostridium bifermentans TaxID=1490 RepID=UPI001F2D8BDA|nr:DarT ssDNA thymidine ADP-ribosyltransferase family protein [Paraclostridium bifermentans]MCE9676017.1 DUF4433 domain-containing protein [Paraclostridium bifermentans]